MHNYDDIELGKVLPGVDLALWVQLAVVALVVIAAGAWALTAI